MGYTTDDLLKSIKNKAFVPTSQITFTDAELLDMATDELYDTVVPLVLQTREEFYVTHTDVMVNGNNIAVDIPERAIGLAVREVSIIRNNNQEENLVRFDIESLPTFNNVGNVVGFYLKGNQIVLIGAFNGPVRIYYHVRPGRLVKPSQCSTVTSIAGADLTVSSIRSGWVSGAKLDFIRAAAGFDTLSPGSVIISTSLPTSVSISAAIDRLAIGDWVTTEGQSPVPQIPVEFFSYLAQLTAVQVLDSLGDQDAKNSAMAKLEKLEANALSMITPRVVGESKKIVPAANRGIYNTSYRGW